MGNTASSTIPATEVLRVTASEEKERGEPAPATDQSIPGDEDLRAGLLMLGVDIGDASMPDARRCWGIVAEQDFWRHHHELHPKKKRVKTWMFVHGKFRASASSVVGAAETMHAAVAEGCPAAKTAAAAAGIESSFRTLLSKIEAHGNFEDTQLFKFFKENVQESGDTMRDLEAEHSETQLEQKALALLKPLQEAPAAATSEMAAEAVAALKTYTASLESHLEKEERALVARWLNLDPEQYAKYRTYLVGKYRLAY